MAVKVDNLTKVYGEQIAVNNISFQVGAGNILGFLGPNGAGKSTTMKMITCFLKPSSGTASVCGIDVHDNSMEIRRRIGYLPEHNPLYLDMYVKEYLKFVASIHKLGNSTNRINEIIELTGLGIEQHKRIGQLSKGYRQRVGLAQSMIHDPEVLILDEPTSGLDPNQLIEIRSLIQSLGKHKTVILSTHIMQEVQAICNRVVIINNGKIVADDLTSNLMSNVKEGYTINVEFEEDTSSADLLKIPGVVDVSKSGSVWQLIADDDIRQAVGKFAVDNQLTIISMSKSEQSLESAFQQLTKSGD